MLNLNLSLPASFYEDEERSGYLVKKEMKALWAVELDLLNKFDEVCKKYDLDYYVDAGTLLGTIRHKGYIPWDDDIDVMMSRKEFNKLCEIAGEAFSEPYFFQTEYTDPGCHTFYGKLRNSNTTARLKPEIQCGYTYNQGIFIDIFVLDNIPDDEDELNIHLNELEKLRIKSIRYARAFQGTKFYSNHKVLNLASPIFAIGRKIVRKNNKPNKYLIEYDNLANKYNDTETKRWAIIGLGDTFIYERAYFEDKIYMPFENLMVPCPKEYEEILKYRYGNWKEFVIGTQIHTISNIDAEVSYKEFL